jgi:hypothetical protein
MRVNRVTLVVGRSLPVYPDQRTSSAPVGMSQTCQDTTWPGFCTIFFAPKKLFPISGFQYTHGNALSVEGSFSFKDAYLPLPNLVELQGDMLS